MQAANNSASGPGRISDRLRSVVSLVLALHLFVLFFALSGNYFRSPLQARILGVLRPYAQLLNFELDFLPYQLTHAQISDVDHRIELLPAGSQADDDSAWLVLPDRGFRGGERYKRYQRLGRLLAFLAEENAGAGPSLLARSVVENALHQGDVRPDQVRVRRHLLQSPDIFSGGTPEQRDPNAPTYFRVVYAANALISETGQVELIKIDDTAEVALPESPQP